MYSLGEMVYKKLPMLPCCMFLWLQGRQGITRQDGVPSRLVWWGRLEGGPFGGFLGQYVFRVAHSACAVQGFPRSTCQSIVQTMCNGITVVQTVHRKAVLHAQTCTKAGVNRAYGDRGWPCPFCCPPPPRAL